MTLSDALMFLKTDMNEQLLGWNGTYSKGKFENIIERLERQYLKASTKLPTPKQHQKYVVFSETHDIRGLEGFFVPEENNYQTVLDNVKPDDVIFDVGAGDLRLDLLLSEKVKKVYAVEINPETVGNTLKIIGLDKPANLTVICGNGFEMELPSDVTLITNLMIHRKHPFPEEWREIDKIYCLIGIKDPIVDRKKEG